MAVDRDVTGRPAAVQNALNKLFGILPAKIASDFSHFISVDGFILLKKVGRAIEFAAFIDSDNYAARVSAFTPRDFDIIDRIDNCDNRRCAGAQVRV